MRKIALILEYDGGRYHGFQYQDNADTIQGELESVIKKITAVNTRVVAASRTDAGVHALGQTITFRTEKELPCETWINALNYYLPYDIRVKEAYEVEDGFNVRKDARSREYKYFILNSRVPSPIKSRYTYHIKYMINLEEMNNVCSMLVGFHDFRAFTSIKNACINTKRIIYNAIFRKKGNVIVFDIEGNSFLPYQIRSMVGSLIQVGLGKMTKEDFTNLLKLATQTRSGPVVPANALFLIKVNYDNFPPVNRRS